MTAINDKALQWTGPEFDEETRMRVKELMENDQEELYECFYKGLEFGTGGMRGLMGVGTNRINIYTVAMATQGLANYLKKNFTGEVSAAIAHDSRINSPLFAQTAADVLSANGIKVYLFEALRPTPELSFAIRELGCKTGIVITASHNPKEYNGYKVYWEDGAQIVAPHDSGIIGEVQKITGPGQVSMKGNPDLIERIGEAIDKVYLSRIQSLSLSPEAIQEQKDIKIVYTGLHGTGITMIPQALKNLGYENVYLVPEQDIPDGNFPTVESPNPEEKEALQKALELAADKEAELVLGTDPDADRVGLALRNRNGEYELINGNQACAVLVWYHLKKWKELGKLNGKQFVAKTVVTTALIDRMANDFNVNIYDTLTGFKFIAGVIRELEGKEEFIAGGEESFGYLAGDFVRDKDAVISAVMFCEIAAWAKSQGKSMLDLLDEIYNEYGCFQEHLVSLKKMGSKGQEEIQAMIAEFRNNPPAEFAGSPVVRVDDLQASASKDLINGQTTAIDLPKSNVIQFFTADGSKITARPSGTEPKIKFYISVNEDVNGNLPEVKSICSKRIEDILKDLSLN